MHKQMHVEWEREMNTGIHEQFYTFYCIACFKFHLSLTRKSYYMNIHRLSSFQTTCGCREGGGISPEAEQVSGGESR